MISEERAVGAEFAEPDYCTYGEFGEQFFRLAVTEDRIVGALGGLSGNDFAFGPMGVGPGRLAKVTAQGRIGQATLAPLDSAHVTFRVKIPVDVSLVVDLGIDQHRFHADVVVTLHLTARAARPLLVVIDVQPPTKQDVEVKLQSESMRASLLRMVAGVDDELRRFVAKYVGKEIEKPALRKARTIDIAARMGRAWQREPEGVDLDLTRKRGKQAD